MWCEIRVLFGFYLRALSLKQDCLTNSIFQYLQINLNNIIQNLNQIMVIMDNKTTALDLLKGDSSEFTSENLNSVLKPVLIDYILATCKQAQSLTTLLDSPSASIHCAQKQYSPHVP